ncbi:alpha-aspartyl dipeptidase. Serine peptidase. MEROPS family S51 [Arsukibacterium tuosuense]|uniref:Alpha-aspartyl dipeptidase. Serine peptidase. MEROPS family S51 n=1 Tax=Arsukibacterium tuosuense TaxID=1323745 RepID=A0A285I008_9GAMM|nr:dipeptidase PepE [Arsukibacterium tuosuense]SNY41227.1 alpha-aspartyl dipeptidase. Serine peptidase. MEROPS family S51 [Arsukibacterium tuosuense]
MQLLLLSSSRANNSAYLAPYMSWLETQLQGIDELLFVSYAGVTITDDNYFQQVASALAPLSIKVTSLHQYADPKAAISEAQAIAVGGGNTFQLLNKLYQQDTVQLIRQRVTDGMPYIGWSAGSNIAGATIRTTNDMPIVEPASFNGLNLLPVQLNPHYSDYKPEGFHGETRDMRLAEFMVLNPTTPIIALPEGTALKCSGDKLTLLGSGGGYLFKGGDKTAIAENSDLSDCFFNNI